MGFRSRDSGYEIAAQNVVAPQFIVSSISAAQTDTQLIAARSGFRMRVYSLFISSGSVLATSVQTLVFNSIGGATAALTGSIRPPGNDVVIWPYNPNGWFQTAAGDGLFLSTTATCLGIGIQAACIPV